jgi:hypothetical protein
MAGENKETIVRFDKVSYEWGSKQADPRRSELSLSNAGRN